MTKIPMNIAIYKRCVFTVSRKSCSVKWIRRIQIYQILHSQIHCSDSLRHQHSRGSYWVAHTLHLPNARTQPFDPISLHSIGQEMWGQVTKAWWRDQHLHVRWLTSRDQVANISILGERYLSIRYLTLWH